MSVLVALGPGSSSWAAGLRRALAAVGVEKDVVVMRDAVPDDVEFVLMWNLSADELAAFPKLEGVLMGGAGYDHLDLATLPDVPFVRLIDPGMATDIASYVLAWTIHFQRDFDHFARAADEHRWADEPRQRFPREVTVGVFGAGAIGSVVRDVCEAHGFATIGWSRSEHDRPLLQFFGDADVVVVLVPLDETTRHIVGAEELSALGDGVLVNVSRGGTVDTAALLDALDGNLRGAVLDVTEPEPLPSDSPLWARDDVIITPHVAGRSDPATAATVVAASIRDLLAGSQPPGTIPRD